MLGVTRKYPSLQRLAGVTVLAAAVSLGAGSSSAQQLTARSDHPQQAAKHAEAWLLLRPVPRRPDQMVKPIQRATVRGPHYVDFRARTAAAAF